MAGFSRLPCYDIRNDGAGPYAIFYCDQCGREFRSQPEAANPLTQDLGRSAVSDLLRKVPFVGNMVANNVVVEDPGYSYKMTPQQIESAWKQVEQHFRECPTCSRIVCLSDFDTQSGFCQKDSPPTNEIAEAHGEQAGEASKGFARISGLDKAAETASQQLARCPVDGTMAAPGTKFCPECGSAMLQPTAAPCPKCGADTHGAKFCPECGTKVEQVTNAAFCTNCGAKTEGARFCPECGTKI